jgi:hypothetical protein
MAAGAAVDLDGARGNKRRGGESGGCLGGDRPDAGRDKPGRAGARDDSRRCGAGSRSGTGRRRRPSGA